MSIYSLSLSTILDGSTSNNMAGPTPAIGGSVMAGSFVGTIGTGHTNTHPIKGVTFKETGEPVYTLGAHLSFADVSYQFLSPEVPFLHRSVFRFAIAPQIRYSFVQGGYTSDGTAHNVGTGVSTSVQWIMGRASGDERRIVDEYHFLASTTRLVTIIEPDKMDPVFIANLVFSTGTECGLSGGAAQYGALMLSVGVGAAR